MNPREFFVEHNMEFVSELNSGVTESNWRSETASPFLHFVVSMELVGREHSQLKCESEYNFSVLVDGVVG